MGEQILQIIFVCGIIYGLITFIVEVKKKTKKEKNQLILSIAVIVTSTASFLLLLD